MNFKKRADKLYGNNLIKTSHFSCFGQVFVYVSCHPKNTPLTFYLYKAPEHKKEVKVLDLQIFFSVTDIQKLKRFWRKKCFKESGQLLSASF